jgi:hypothetical protein
MAAGGRDGAPMPRKNTSNSIIDTLAFSICWPYNGFNDGRKPEMKYEPVIKDWTEVSR